MDYHQFRPMIIELCQYFERKAPADEVIMLWLKEVDHIGNKYLDWIKVQIKKRYEKFPLNIAFKIQELHAEYINSNPEPDKQKVWCDECGGVGYLHVRRFKGQLPYSYTFLCGVCNQGYAPAIPAVTLALLKQKGFKEYLPKPTKNQVMSEKEKEGLKKLFGVIRRPATDRKEQEKPKAMKEIIEDEIPF